MPWLPDKLFFAVLPTPTAAERIAQQADRLRRRYRMGGQPLSTERLHVTLRGVGSYSCLPADVLAAAIVAGSSVEVAPFEVTVDQAVSFRGKQALPFVLRCGRGVPELTTMRNVLGTAMRRTGLALGDRSSFTPHVTMLYDKQSVPETSMDEPITWTAREFVLVHSLQGKGRHVFCMRWRLRG